MLDNERLDVYQGAIEHQAFVFRSIGVVPESDLAAAKQPWVRAVGMPTTFCRGPWT